MAVTKVRSLTPQAQQVLLHLQTIGPITPVEAAAVYKFRHLPSKIHEIKRKTRLTIITRLMKDATGQRYARYSIS